MHANVPFTCLRMPFSHLRFGSILEIHPTIRDQIAQQVIPLSDKQMISRKSIDNYYSHTLPSVIIMTIKYSII